MGNRADYKNTGKLIFLDTSEKHKPKLSVLVMTYKRKEFIVGALESVLNQTLTRSEYEIICSIGFRDDELSRFLRENDIKEIFCDGTVGEMLTQGILACNSDFVVFLEDDDQFRNDKLERALLAFQKYGCVYYHNNVQLIDVDGNKIIHRVEPYHMQVPHSYVWYPVRGYRMVLKHRGDFNLSSIAVARTEIIKYCDTLKTITTCPDSIIFFLLMQKNLSLCFDAETTTQYRIHKSETNMASDLSKSQAIKVALRFYFSRLAAYNSMKSIPVRKIFNGYVLESKFGAYIRGEKELKPNATEELKFLYIGIARPSRFYLRLFAATWIYSLFPSYVDKVRKRREIRRYKDAR